MFKDKSKLLYALIIAGMCGGFYWTVREGGKFTDSPLYIVRSKLETKVDSLQDEKNYWIALKDSSGLVELAKGFISKYDKQIGDASYKISEIENNPEFKKLKIKACSFLHSNGVRTIYGSILFGLAGLCFNEKDRRKKPEQQS